MTTPAALDRVGADGYAVDEEEQKQEIGVRCVAVALPVTGGLHLAVSVSGPTERFTAKWAWQLGRQRPGNPEPPSSRAGRGSW